MKQLSHNIQVTKKYQVLIVPAVLRIAVWLILRRNNTILTGPARILSLDLIKKDPEHQYGAQRCGKGYDMAKI